MKRFEEKVAIITGGAQGIGEAITRRLANEGAMTAILDIQLDKAQAVAEEILSQGGKKSITVRMDITDCQDVKRAVQEVEETFGRVDVLINNVGGDEFGLFIESTEESWDWKIAQVRDNLRVLRRDRVDVLLGHDMEWRRFWKPDARDLQSSPEWRELLDIDESLDYENAPVMQALREAKAQGFCRYLGLSSGRAETLANVLQQVKLDMCLPACGYSLMNRTSPRVMLPVIREQGMAYVIGGIFSVWGKGLINGSLFKDARLLELARATGLSIAAMSVRFLMANQEIATILVGASTPEEIEESVVAAQAGPLPPDIQQTLEALAPT